MKKKFVVSMLAAAFAFTAVEPSAAWAKTTTTTTIIEDKYEDDSFDEESEGMGDEAEENGEDDRENGGEFTKYDIRATPAKKTIKIGRSFYIDVEPEDDSEWEDLPDEEWEEICDENIDEITFRSTNSSVASVNKKTGRVKAKRKGTAVIKTQINLASGETVTYKTKVYVIR